MFDRAVKLGLRPPETLQGWAAFELHNDLSPWIPQEIQRHSLMITEYIGFWISGSPLPHLRRRRILYLLGHLIRALCLLRWRWRWFGWPLDYHLYKWLLRFWKPVT